MATNEFGLVHEASRCKGFSHCVDNREPWKLTSASARDRRLKPAASRSPVETGLENNSVGDSQPGINAGPNTAVAENPVNGVNAIPRSHAIEWQATTFQTQREFATLSWPAKPLTVLSGYGRVTP
jgi:hypothetical protein